MSWAFAAQFSLSKIHRDLKNVYFLTICKYLLFTSKNNRQKKIRNLIIFWIFCWALQMGKLFFDLVKFGVLKQFGTTSRVPNFFFKNHSTLIFMYMYVYIRPYKKRWDNNSWTSLEYCTLNVHLIVKIKFEANSRQICDFYFCLCNICPLSVWPSSIACPTSFCLLSLSVFWNIFVFYLLSVSLLLSVFYLCICFH